MRSVFIFVIGILLFVLGVAIGKFKCYWLISGYNMASDEEKENVDIKGLARAISFLLYGIGCTIIVSALLEPYFPNIISLMGIFILIITIGTVIYCQRFDSNKKSKSEKLGLVVILAIPVLIFIVVLAASTEKNKVEVTQDRVTIEGMYGINLSNEEFKSIDLVDRIPTIVKKENGSSIWKYKKGIFLTKENERIHLYLEKDYGPYLKIVSTKGDIYMNFKGENEILNVYNEIKSR